MTKPESNIIVFTDECVASCFLDILRNAKKEVALVSPYLKLWGHLKDQIVLARERGVQVGVLIRDDTDIDTDELEWLEDQGVIVGSVEWLHAKIYFNETDLVVSSMDLTKSPTNNAKDIALVIKGEKDQGPIREYVETLLLSAWLRA